MTSTSSSHQDLSIECRHKGQMLSDFLSESIKRRLLHNTFQKISVLDIYIHVQYIRGKGINTFDQQSY